jgi:hypothetical protein
MSEGAESALGGSLTVILLGLVGVSLTRSG